MTAGVRGCADTNSNRVAGNRDEVEGVVASTLHLFRNGARLLAKAFGVGSTDWLDAHLVMCFGFGCQNLDTLRVQFLMHQLKRTH